jgi:Spy/CpxP family protein refolding chaperone
MVEVFPNLASLSRHQEAVHMTRQLSLAAVALAVAAMVSIPVVAQQGPPMRGGRGGMGPGGPGGPGPLPMLRDLNLTDAQREQIRAISEAQREKGPGPGQHMAELQKSLQLAVLADSPDQQKLDELKTAIAAAEAEELVVRIDLESRVAQVLTPEQRAQARESVEKMGAPNGRGRGPGRGPGRH